ncbi:MAG: hypothetical protein KGL46_08045 [Hyphomicrobiales bacterium]|nr:hypothetical protein [Hyphomicrobiales bacterium]
MFSPGVELKVEIERVFPTSPSNGDLKRLRAALRRERALAGCAGYDIARHRALCQAWRQARAAMGAAERAKAPPP